MICVRCDKRIKPGEDYHKVIVAGASAGGTDIYAHDWCAPAPLIAEPRRYSLPDRY